MLPVSGQHREVQPSSQAIKHRVAAPRINTKECVMNVSCVYLRDAMVYSERLHHLCLQTSQPALTSTCSFKTALSNDDITMSLNKREHSLIQTDVYRQGHLTIRLHSKHRILYMCSMYNAAPLISYSTLQS